MMVSACSGNNLISVRDGHMISTQGKSTKDKETGLISYRYTDANTHQLQQQDVKELVENLVIVLLKTRLQSHHNYIKDY